MTVVSVCLPSDTLSQCLPSYLGFSYLGCGVSLDDCSSKVQPLLLTLDEVTPTDLECGVAPLNSPVPMQPLLLGCEEVANRFKGLDLIDRVKEELWTEEPDGESWLTKHRVAARVAGQAQEGLEELSHFEGQEQQLCFAGATVKR